MRRCCFCVFESPSGIISLLSLIDVSAVCMCLQTPDEVFVSSADSTGLSLDLLCPSPVSCNTNNPTTQQPNNPTTQQPNNPTTQQPNNPTTQQPNNPTTTTAQQHTTTHNNTTTQQQHNNKSTTT